jgi:uncharacterized protein YndB with AHSA1/START domain
MAFSKKKDEFNITHELKAPKKLVFEAFGNAEALNEWWGPANSRNTVIKLDFRVGGIFHYKMEDQGKVSYGRFLFAKIQPFDVLEFSNAFADEHANVVSPPFDLQLPLEFYYRLVISEKAGKTTISLNGRPINATEEQWSTFNSINNSMREGFGATFAKLVQYLDRIQHH